VQKAVSTTQSETEVLRAEKIKLEMDKIAVETKLEKSLLRAQSETEKIRAEKCRLEEDKTTIEA
jgi:hypothetical protein